jgi:hypothetical protein
VVFGTLVHPSVELGDLLIKQAFFNWLQIAESLIVSSQKLIKLVNVPHVILFLKSYVDNSLRNFLANAIKELGFTNDNFQLW